MAQKTLATALAELGKFQEASDLLLKN